MSAASSPARHRFTDPRADLVLQHTVLPDGRLRAISPTARRSRRRRSVAPSVFDLLHASRSHSKAPGPRRGAREEGLVDDRGHACVQCRCCDVIEVTWRLLPEPKRWRCVRIDPSAAHDDRITVVTSDLRGRSSVAWCWRCNGRRAQRRRTASAAVAWAWRFGVPSSCPT